MLQSQASPMWATLRKKAALPGCGRKGERATASEGPTCAGLRGVTLRPSRCACAGPAGPEPSSACGEAHPRRDARRCKAAVRHPAEAQQAAEGPKTPGLGSFSAARSA